MSFKQEPVKKPKSHSPTQENQTWSHEEARTLLHAHPQQQKINWSEASWHSQQKCRSSAKRVCHASGFQHSIEMKPLHDYTEQAKKITWR